MSVYTAPLRDMLFTMKEVGGLEAICAQPGHEETTPDLVEAILQEAAHYAAGVLDSLNRTGDVQGARWHELAALGAVGLPAPVARLLEELRHDPNRPLREARPRGGGRRGSFRDALSLFPRSRRPFRDRDSSGQTVVPG